jgi:hypothetical protein
MLWFPIVSGFLETFFSAVFVIDFGQKLGSFGGNPQVIQVSDFPASTHVLRNRPLWDLQILSDFLLTCRLHVLAELQSDNPGLDFFSGVDSNDQDSRPSMPSISSHSSRKGLGILRRIFENSRVNRALQLGPSGGSANFRDRSGSLRVVLRLAGRRCGRHDVRMERCTPDDVIGGETD